MNIRVMSRNEAVAHSYKQDIPKCVIISINCLGDSTPVFYKHADSTKERIMAVLKLNFNDIDRPYNNLEPKQENLVGLKAFIDKFKNDSEIEEIIVHCAAGISRSSAVAAAICQYLDLDELNIIWNNPNFVPNSLVYKLALKELGLEWNEAQFAYYLAMNKLERDKLEIPEDIEILDKAIKEK